MATIHLRNGDCVEVMRTLADGSVGAIVSDPPYGLRFMGKEFDDLGDRAAQREWHRAWVNQAFRVIRPGGVIKAFGGTRTFHHLAAVMREAGFTDLHLEAWGYGSGFPKSLDVSKAIDKRGGNAHLTAEIGAALKAARKSRGIGITEADRTYCSGVTLWSWYEGRPAGQQMPTAEVMRKIANDWPDLQRYADLTEEAEREVVGQDTKARSTSGKSALPTMGGETVYESWDITAPATAAARTWDGWGTALKPAWEPVLVGTKPA